MSEVVTLNYDWRVWWHYEGESVDYRTSTLIAYGSDPAEVRRGVIDAHQQGEVIIDRVERL